MLLAGQGAADGATPASVRGVRSLGAGPGDRTLIVSGEAIRFAADAGTSDGGGESSGDGGNSAGGGNPAGDAGNPVGDAGDPAGDGGTPAGDGGDPAGDGAKQADGAARPKHGNAKPKGTAKPKGGGAKSKRDPKPKPNGDDGESTTAGGDPGAGNITDPPPAGAPAPTVPTLTRSVAMSRTKSVLSRRFGPVYTRGNHKRLSCRSQGAGSYVCSVSWRYHRQRYDGRAILSPSGRVRTHIVSRRG